MKKFAFIISLVSLIITSCNNGLDDDKKIEKDSALIHQFFKTQRAKSIEEASIQFLNKTSFFSFVYTDIKRTQTGYKYNFLTFDEEEENESYVAMLFDLLNRFNHDEKNAMNIHIDSIKVDSIKYRVYQTIQSPLLEEYSIKLPKKTEDFYIKNDTITKVILQSVYIDSKTDDFSSEFAYWIYKFTGKEIFDYKSLILGKADDDFKKSVVDYYRNYISFVSSLDLAYTFYSNLRKLHEQAFLTQKVEDEAIELYLEFEGLEYYFDAAIQDENDSTKLVHLNFSQNGVSISAVTRVQDSTAFSHLKPKQMCAVFGLGGKNMVGELQLKDAVVFSFISPD